MKPKNKTKQENIVKPSTRVGEELHPLEKMFEGDPAKLPEMKSIGYTNLGPGNQWVSYVITTKGKEVLSIEIDEPNVRAIAEEASKINFVNCFVDQGF